MLICSSRKIKKNINIYLDDLFLLRQSENVDQNLNCKIHIDHTAKKDWYHF